MTEKQKLLDRIKHKVENEGLKDMHFTFGDFFHKLDEEGRAEAINKVLDAIESGKCTEAEPFGDSRGRRTDVF
jgi:hypothetical protein